MLQETFEGLWNGGYYEGNPLDPVGSSGYGEFGYVSSLYLTYRICIQPYVNSKTAVLEIGPGRGAWTKCFVHCGAKEIWALDAVSAEQNCFWDYVGVSPNIRYFKVTDEKCAMVPDESIDYFFSFGTFCHLTNAQIVGYVGSAYRTMKSGAHGFFMFADYDKYNAMIDNRKNLAVPISPGKGKHSPWVKLAKTIIRHTNFRKQDKQESQKHRPGRFYHYGTEDVVRMVGATGFRVLSSDVEVNHRDPVIHFQKPALVHTNERSRT